MNSGEYFYNLTPDIILNSIETLGFEPTGRYIPLNSIENRVYDIQIEDQIRLVVKFYRPARWNHSQISEEHSFLKELELEEVPVLGPMVIGGESIFQTHGMYYAVWPLRNGRIVEELKGNDLTRVGSLLGRLHMVGRKNQIQTRPNLDLPHYAKKALDFLIDGDWIQNQSLAKRYENTVKQSFALYESVIKNYNIPFQRIHGDCHKGNLLVSKEGFCLLDFDDFLNGPVIQDFWMLLPMGESSSPGDLELFLDGYQMFSDFDRNWLQLIEPLRIIRYVHYAAWIAKRWLDPSFPSIFPHFGTEEYWLKETIDLESAGQELKIDLAIDEIETKPDKTELSNKDFFWDWEG
ncbi:serine/threonine protein kinase [Leptospira sp. 96542]|nr:serine/threonine protein kinase [Leptospira sp. 96542]